MVIPAAIAGKPVTRIGLNAFAGRSQLTSVAIPSSVTLIDSSAFSRCERLTNLTIPSSVTTIGSRAFEYCYGLTSLPLQPGLKTIGINAFTYCGGLASVTLPSGLLTIGGDAFAGTALTTVMVPSSVNSIGSRAFGVCTRLTSIVVDPASLSYSSMNGVLFNQSKSLLMQYPIAVSGDYEIPSSVTTIGADAFYGADELTGVSIPSSVTNIGDRAFSYCPWLGSVTIPPAVTHIGVRAFANSGLTGAVIPSSVTVIGASAFSFCSNMKFISVDAANMNFSSNNGVLFNKDQTVLIQCPAGTSGACQIPTGVTSIGNEAFFGCSKLKRVAIPSGVISIGDYAFTSCSSLTKVSIPASVTHVGNYAFSYCYSLISAAFVGNAPSMGTGVFQGAASGFKVYYLNGATAFTSPTWSGYPAVNFGNLTAVASWLVSQGFSYTSSLKEDSDGDGVSLLMAYALNLDPNQNLGGSLPQPVIAANQMSLSFYAGREGVTYAVESSADTKAWSTDGVTISAPDANQIRTAIVDGSGPSRFMRLSVSH
ncbi:MAG: leucine-rich repeat domain-containing protein [Verrucomicrobiota bacterium]